MNKIARTDSFAPDCSSKALAGTSKILLRVFPSLTDLAFLLPIITLFMVSGGARDLLGDGDTGWHIRTGDWILQHRQVPHKDLFSFTKPNGDWFAWEWGCDVLFSVIHNYWSLSGLVLLSTLVLGLVGVLVYRLVRRHAANDPIALIFTTLVLVGSTLHWLARPHLLSWIFILVFLHLMEHAENGKKHLLWWSPLLVALWVNLHGSFFIGIVFLLTHGVANTLQAIFLSGNKNERLSEIRNQRIYFVCSLACLGASLFNPYGWHLHQHVIRYLLDAKQLSNISEYASISFHESGALYFEVFLLLGICAAFQCFTKGRWAQAITIILWAHFALKSARNIPIFLFIAAPPSAALVKTGLQALQQGTAARPLRRLSSAILSFGQDFRNFERVERLPLVPAVATILVAVCLGIVSNKGTRLVDFDKRDFPVNAASVIAQQPSARVFTFDQWGDYLIYRFFPRKFVFVDGRSDFYGADFSDQWVGTIRAKYNWSKELSRFSIDTVLLRTSDPLASVLKQSNEWKSIFDDKHSIVFRRTDAAAANPAGASTRRQLALLNTGVR